MAKTKLTGRNLFNLLRQLSFSERLAFAELIRDVPKRLGPNGLHALTGGAFYAVKRADTWDLPAGYVPETFKVFNSESRHEFQIPGGGKVMTFQEMFLSKNSYLAELVQIKNKNTKPKKRDTRDLMLEINRLQRDLYWDDVFKEMRRKTKRWSCVSSMKRAFYAYKKDRPL